MGVAVALPWLTAYRASPRLLQRWSELRTVSDVEALAAEVHEPWRALLILCAASFRLTEGNVDLARRYLLAFQRSEWLRVLPTVRSQLFNDLGLLEALEGRLDSAEARFLQARAETPPELRPYLHGTDIIVHLRRSDAAAARRALEDRERGFRAYPPPDEASMRQIDRMRALFAACILSAEGAGAEAIDRELTRANRGTLLGWSEAWPTLRPLARRATELLNAATKAELATTGDGGWRDPVAYRDLIVADLDGRSVFLRRRFPAGSPSTSWSAEVGIPRWETATRTSAWSWTSWAPGPTCGTSCR